jgi:hypothetical protein
MTKSAGGPEEPTAADPVDPDTREESEEQDGCKRRPH